MMLRIRVPVDPELQKAGVKDVVVTRDVVETSQGLWIMDDPELNDKLLHEPLNIVKEK